MFSCGNAANASQSHSSPHGPFFSALPFESIQAFYHITKIGCLKQLYFTPFAVVRTYRGLLFGNSLWEYPMICSCTASSVSKMLQVYFLPVSHWGDEKRDSLLYEVSQRYIQPRLVCSPHMENDESLFLIIKYSRETSETISQHV